MLSYGNSDSSDSPFPGTNSEKDISNEIYVNSFIVTEGMVTAISITIGSSCFTEVFKTKLPMTLMSSGFANATEYFSSGVGPESGQAIAMPVSFCKDFAAS